MRFLSDKGRCILRLLVVLHKGRSLGIATMAKFALLTIFFLSGLLSAAEPASKWIWTSEPGTPGADVRYFRKTFTAGDISATTTLTITCDNEYEVFINEKSIGIGNEWKEPGVYNIAKWLVRGANIIAVKGENEAPGAAGLIVDLDGGRNFHIVSGADWKWSKFESDGWTKANFDDAQWLPSKEIGPDDTAPWSLKGWPKAFVEKENLAPAHGTLVNGFRVPEDFTLDNFALDKDTSSVLCMCFNAKGQLLTAAAGSGPTEIRMVETANGAVTGHHLYHQGLHCQGLCAVGNDIYAVGNGRLFLLPDNGAGRAATQTALSPKSLGGMEEHGPHAVVHGPDGKLYLVLGNNSSFEMSNIAPSSPIREEHLYWGNLLPLQSSNGFMDGKGPPGGRILRTDLQGKSWEMIACGFRNDYDFAFSSTGEIFGFDSDMEWDIGLPWYRPVRTVHIPIGANFGWRYGSGKWRNHTPDSVPPMSEIGRGSPTGVEVYNHVALPEDFRDAVFYCDWSRARVLVGRLERSGATWKEKIEEFVVARGANFPVTDCCVGPDGALYFSYGGRATKGGVIRVRYTGDKAIKSFFPESDLRGLSPELSAALNTPQYLSAYGRAAIAVKKAKLGDTWKAELSALARDANRPEALRSRALDLLGMDGGTIGAALLAELAASPSPLVRAQAVQRMSLNGDAEARAKLPAMLDDKEPWVLRRACEGLLSAPNPAAEDKLLNLLGHADRFVRYAASQALLRLPRDSWAPKLQTLERSTSRAEGLLTWAQSFQSLKIDGQKIAPEFERMLRRGAELINLRLEPDDMFAALRAVSLMLIARADKTALPTHMRDRLVASTSVLLDHPDPRIRADAAELLGYLGSARSIAPLLAKITNEKLPRPERIQYAVAVSEIAEGWDATGAAQVLEFLALPPSGDDGASFKGNMTQTAARLAKALSPDLRVATFNTLTPPARTFAVTAPGFNTMGIQVYIDTYQKAATFKEKSDILEKLAAPGTAEAFRAIEKLVEESSPMYDTALTHLMRFNHADAKKYAVLALSSPSRGLAAAALDRVQTFFKEDPEDPNVYYGLIVCAARSSEARDRALALLKKWPIDDKALAKLPAEPEKQLEFWEQLFKENFKQDKRKFPVLAGEGLQEPGRFAKLVDFVKANPKGNPEAGKELFKTTKCITCHAFKGEGQQLGPDLTDVAKRFEVSKILEDIVYPSKVVDARYRQVLHMMRDGQRMLGFVSAETDESLSVTNTEAITVSLKKADVINRRVTDQSIMPNALLDALTPEQVRDLISFLESGKK